MQRVPLRPRVVTVYRYTNRTNRTATTTSDNTTTTTVTILILLLMLLHRGHSRRALPVGYLPLTG